MTCEGREDESDRVNEGGHYDRRDDPLEDLNGHVKWCVSGYTGHANSLLVGWSWVISSLYILYGGPHGSINRQISDLTWSIFGAGHQPL